MSDDVRTCPRCRHDAATVVATSPVSGIWAIWSCPRCWYAWRSTEALEQTDPEDYPERFRLSASDLDGAPGTV